MVLALGRYTMAQKQHMLLHLIIMLVASSAAPSSNGLQDASRDQAAVAVTAAANNTQASQLQTTPTATAPLSSGHSPPAVITSAAGGPHPHNITQQHHSGVMTHHDPSSLAASRRPPAAPPLTRRIVPDLTPQLQTELAAHNISVLLVVTDPAADSSSSSINSMKIDWNSLTMLKKVYFLNSYKEFQQKWSTYLLLHHDQPAAHQPPGSAVSELPGQQQLQRQLLRRHLSQPPAEAGSQSQQVGAAGAQTASHSSQQLLCDTLCGGTISQQLHHRKHHEHHEHPAPSGVPNVAVMSWVVNGRVGLKQLHLVEAVSRRIRRMHKLNLDYSTWNDKGDSLIAFTPDGQPQSAVFLTTTIYRDAFSKIYSGKKWGPDGGGSGLGSTLNYTMNIRQELPRLIAKYNISSMLDSSCGSMHWMPEVVQAAAATRPNFKFMGTDVVCSLIEQHQATFVNITNMQFQCIDYSNQNLPSGYDLIFSRDSLQHVPKHAAWMFLNNVKASGARYLLVGSYLDLENVNGKDIAGGDYYAIDLTRPPFNVWPAVEVIDEQTADGKHMVLFDMRSATWADDLQGLV